MSNLRTPRNASTTFSLGGSQTPRPKGLFVVNFRTNQSNISGWQRDIGFLVKSIDQPTISPKTEELNQYNKKRQIYTGYTTNPVNITIYDTADALALQMWAEYARYYFGDFAQSENNYKYDQTSASMFGEDIGYGLLGTSDIINFFAAIDIYQVFRNAYTKTTLINPRISAFDPEDLDYERMEASMHRVTVVYESVIYNNNGAPAAIDSDPVLATAFKDVRLHGDIIEVSGPAAPPMATSLTQIADASTTSPLGGLSGILGGLNFLPTSSSSGAVSGLGGVLSAFGKFDLAAGLSTTVQAVVSGNTRNLGSQLVYSATGNSQLATIVGGITSSQPTRTVVSQVLNGALSNGGINPQTYAVAQSTIAAVSGNKTAQGGLAGAAVKAIMGSSIITGKPVQSQASVPGKSGLTLAPQAMSLLNSALSPLAKLGIKKT